MGARLYLKNEPQMKAPRVTPLEGVYTYCFAIRGRGVENPQGFGMMNADLLKNSTCKIRNR